MQNGSPLMTTGISAFRFAFGTSTDLTTHKKRES